MTDKLHYPDLFKTINIPESEKNLALEAHHLYDVASQGQVENEIIFAYMRKRKLYDAESASQIFWEFENGGMQTYDQLALTAIHNGLVVALEHRNFERREQGIRKTLTLSNGHSSVYVTDIVGSGRVENIPSSTEFAVESFKKDFYGVTIANLGLTGYIERLKEAQNESSEAILANAA
ncbi:MAG TPA: hypothetical protein VIM37_03175 [Candidatus Microsaccharimonas sp.]|jgi:hypothetical protein